MAPWDKTRRRRRSDFIRRSIPNESMHHCPPLDWKDRMIVIPFYEQLRPLTHRASEHKPQPRGIAGSTHISSHRATNHQSNACGPFLHRRLLSGSRVYSIALQGRQALTGVQVVPCPARTPILLPTIAEGIQKLRRQGAPRLPSALGPRPVRSPASPAFDAWLSRPMAGPLEHLVHLPLPFDSGCQ